MTGELKRRRNGSKFNAATWHGIVALVKAGVSPANAARQSGVHPSTMWRWFQRGEYDLSCGRETDHAEFAEAFATADAEVVGKVERMVISHARNDWKAGAHVLAKRSPSVWGDKRAAEEVAQKTADALLDRVRTACAPEVFEAVLEAVTGAAVVDGVEVLESPPGRPEDALCAPEAPSDAPPVIEAEPLPPTPRPPDRNFDTSQGKFGLAEPRKKRRK